MKSLKRRFNARLERTRALVRMAAAHTWRRETLTSRPLLKFGLRCMRRRVSTAIASGHRQERRMPVSWAGRFMMNRNPFARWWCVVATSSSSPSDEARIGLSGREGTQFKSGRAEDVPRQPAYAAAAVLPHVLEDVDHLQPLTEGDRQRQQIVPPSVDLVGVVAKAAQSGVSPTTPAT